MRTQKNKVFRRMGWRKLRYDFWVDAVSSILSGTGITLRAFFEVRARLDDSQRVSGAPVPGVGWMLTDCGFYVTAEMLAALVRFPLADVEAALEVLLDNHVFVRSDGGLWGTVGWSDRQDEDIFGNRRGLDPTSIYFIQSGLDGPIKIGISSDPVFRMTQMQTGMPHTLRLLAFYPGTRVDEQKLHKQLAKFRIRGEWFQPCEEVFAAIRSRNAPR